jgi:hypothetical protein
MYEAYAEYKRDKAVSHNQFKEILKDYFEECGGYEVKTKRWYGTYYNREKEKVDVDKPMHSYILTYKQVAGDNLLREMFPANEEQTVFIRKYEKKSDGENNSEFSDPGTFVMDDEAPF